MGTRRAHVEGEFAYEHPMEVRFVDTDAFGHVNNAVYLSYFEAARAGYYAAVTGIPFGTGESAGERTFVIAEAHVVYRSPAFFGEQLVVSCRFDWTGFSSFGIAYRIRSEESALGPARVVADGETVQVFYDLKRGRPMKVPADLVAQFENYEKREIPRRS
jgi:acyl-CoA thioester hydrolase